MWYGGGIVRPGGRVIGPGRKGTNRFRGPQGSSADTESTLDSHWREEFVGSGGCHVNKTIARRLICQLVVAMLSAAMSTRVVCADELRVWHAFLLMGEDVLGRVGRDIAQATGLSGAEFGVLSRLAALGKGEMRQQALARVMTWDKSRLSHQLTRMQQRGLIELPHAAGNTIPVFLT